MSPTTGGSLDCSECRVRLLRTWERDQDKVLALSAEVKLLTDKIFAARFGAREVKDLTAEEVASFYAELVPTPGGYAREEDFGFVPVAVDAEARFPSAVGDVLMPPPGPERR
jgi:hypothetical protein